MTVIRGALTPPTKGRHLYRSKRQLTSGMTGLTAGGPSGVTIAEAVQTGLPVVIMAVGGSRITRGVYPKHLFVAFIHSYTHTLYQSFCGLLLS